MRLDVTFGGAARLDGDLTPACAAALTAVLDALGAKGGPEDTRTAPQRRHDALEEACRRLTGAGGLPDVAGAADPGTAAHDSRPAPRPARRGRRRGRLARGPGRRRRPARVDPQPGRRRGLRLRREDRPCRHRPPRPGLARGPGPRLPRRPPSRAGLPPARVYLPGRQRPRPRSSPPAAIPGRPGAATARLTGTLLRFAADTLSGPAGLAAHLRTTLPGIQSCGISLPLDTGSPTGTVPPHLRRAVIARDRHCTFPGCAQRPAACQVHHLLPRSRGGPTAVGNLALLCPFHHLIAVHRWGWSLTLHGDGTTIAVSPDGKRTLRSHGPPAAATA